MLKRRIFVKGCVALMVALMCLATAVPAFSGRHPGRSDGTCPFKLFIVNFLDLTADQQAAFATLQAETGQEMEPLMKEKEALDLDKTLLAEEIDLEEANEKLDRSVELECEMSAISAAAKLEGTQILTSDQRLLLMEHVGNLIDLVQYIADYPGWDEIKKDFEEDIKPVLDQMDSNELGITEEQEAAFEDLQTETHELMEPLAEELHGLDIHEVLLAEEIDVDNATARLDRMVELECEMKAISAEASLEAAQILTPEQRKELASKKNRKNHPRFPRR